MSQLKEVVSTSAKMRDDRLTFLLEQYNQYKTSFVKHLLFDPDEQSLSKILSFGNMYVQFCISDATIEHALLQAVYIYFDTATYDEIERDVKVGEYVHNNHHRVCMKVTIEAQLGLIGGTMGLLTGFSILSGVEIIYYLIRFFFT